MHHLMGVQEIADLLGVSRQRADQLSRQKGFPEPTMLLSHGRQRVWEAADVEQWKRERDARGQG